MMSPSTQAYMDRAIGCQQREHIMDTFVSSPGTKWVCGAPHPQIDTAVRVSVGSAGSVDKCKSSPTGTVVFLGRDICTCGRGLRGNGWIHGYETVPVYSKIITVAYNRVLA